MSDTHSSDQSSYWSIRVLSAADQRGFLGEVYHEQALSLEMVDSSLQPIAGAWMRTLSYRTLTAYATEETAREAAERLRSFLYFANMTE